MAEVSFPFWACCQELDHGLILVEALGFPEISRLGRDRDKLIWHLERNLHKLMAKTALDQLLRRHLGGVPETSSVDVLLDPFPGNGAWREPLKLNFPVLHWQHAGFALAFIPALGIEVVANKPGRMDQQLQEEIRAALMRGRKPLTLERLVACQRLARVTALPRTFTVDILSARQRQLTEERRQGERPSILAQVAIDLTRGPETPTIGLEPVATQLAEIFTSARPRSVLLIGPSGVGKTAALRELVRRRAEYNLGTTPFWSTSGARLVAGMSGYGMWQERCRNVVREAARHRVILHLGNLIELMHVGKSEMNQTGIAAFLRPALVRGELLAVAECTPEQLALIERDDPHLLDAFVRLAVPEPEPVLGRAILEFAARHAPMDLRRTLPVAVLETIDWLHRRYATYSAYPGRPLRFLFNLLNDQRSKPDLAPGDVLAAFTRETGLPHVLLDPAVPLDLARTRAWFNTRVIGQDDAVDLVVDLLAVTKAGLARPRKPIASLLFIGPTGVGKTEMAKTLAEFLFSSRQRLIRFDMSEFADLSAVQRLVGGVAGSEGLLTARVREQPFSVLLLDEFEKAHPQFFDLLLQMLGEGRLTDAGGRVADFCNTVVILTSNLGAESYQQGGFGFASSTRGTEQQRIAREHFVAAVQDFLRPELFNRIDRIIPFLPLDGAAIERVARRHLDALQTRDGIKYRRVALELEDGVVEHLARAGFDIRYGARPLLRTIERELLAPLADELNRFQASEPLIGRVQLTQDRLAVVVNPRPDNLQPETSALVEVADRCVGLRRKVQQLEASAAARELANELYQLEREQKLYEHAQLRRAYRRNQLARAPEEVRARLQPQGQHTSREDEQRMATLARLRQVSSRLHQLATDVTQLEDRALHALHAGEDTAGDSRLLINEYLLPLERFLHQLMLTFYCRQFTRPDVYTLVLFSEEHGWLLELAAAYRQVALSDPNGQVDLVVYQLPGNGAREITAEQPEGEKTEAGEARFTWRRRPATDPLEDSLIAAAVGRKPEQEILRRIWIKDLSALPARIIGIGMQIRALAATPRFAPEPGLHLLKMEKQAQPARVLVDGAERELETYLPPEGITRRGAIGSQERRRIFDRTLELVEDLFLQRSLIWRDRALACVLADAIEERLQRNLLSVLED